MKARDVILISTEVAATIATLAIVFRIVGGPDALKLIKMKGAKYVENMAMTNAKGWANVADVANKVYVSNGWH